MGELPSQKMLETVTVGIDAALCLIYQIIKQAYKLCLSDTSNCVRMFCWVYLMLQFNTQGERSGDQSSLDVALPLLIVFFSTNTSRTCDSNRLSTGCIDVTDSSSVHQQEWIQRLSYKYFSGLVLFCPPCTRT